jgi:hypothetical protein
MAKIHDQKITTPNVAKMFQICLSKFGQFLFQKNNIKTKYSLFTFTFCILVKFQKTKFLPFIDLV